MLSSSSSRGHSSSLRRFFHRRRHRLARGASKHTTHATGAALQQSQARRIRLLNSWSLPELFVLRELVHIAVQKTTITLNVSMDLQALQCDARGEERTRIGVSSSASFSSSATSATPPSVASSRGLDRHQQLEMIIESALVHSKRIHFSRRANLRLRLNTRRQFVRLFPLLGRASKAAQYTLFQAFDANKTGKIEFEELCEMLVKVKVARSSSVREMAELAFAWFQGDGSNAVMTSSDVKLLAVTVRELGCNSKVQTEQGYDLALSLNKLLLGAGQSQVTKQHFCQEMDCELGAHVLHVLLAPFEVVKALFDEASILQEMDNMQWKTGDTAFVVSSSWWNKWQRYVWSDHSHNFSLLKKTYKSNDSEWEQEAGDQQMQEQNTQQQQQVRFTVCHPRPGPIANSDICANEHLSTLRRDLAEGKDFVLVPGGVWKRLLQVYGGGPAFPRRIIGAFSVGEQQEMPSGEEDAKANDATMMMSKPEGGQQEQQVDVELYPVALQVRLARHDSRHVYLVYSRRFLLHRASTLMEIVHRMGIFPGINASEVTLWLRRRRLQAWVRLECSLDDPHASLEGLKITSAQELLVDFRAMDIDTDPQSIAQQHLRSSLATILPRTPFAVAMLQPVGNDFLCCPSSSLDKFARSGDWKVLRESMAAEQEAASSASSALLGSGRILAGLAKQMETVAKTSRGRLLAHVGLRATGLINMGNTCFMNSALQCFFHSPVFREYFLSSRFEPEVNKKNRLGSRGAIAAAYAQLQSALWRERDQGYLLPGRFRDEFTRVCSHFEETRQYDAHEFMVALLDCLHEDLNQGCRTMLSPTEDVIQEKGSRCLGFGSFIGEDIQESDTEDSQAHFETSGTTFDEVQGDAAWHDYTSVNSSVVVDLFHGQMRSETVCGTCGERNCTFDPNLFFSLPIPEPNFVRVEVSVLLQARKLPGDDDDSGTALQAEQRGYWLRRGSNVGALCDRIATVHVRASGNRFLLVEVCRNRIKRIVEKDELVDKLATAAPGSLAAYERAWTLAEIPVVPATIVEYYNACATGITDAGAKERADEKLRSFSDLQVGSRVDAKDNHNDWRTGTVIEVAGSRESERKNVRVKHHQRVHVHFDAFSSKWNKWFNARDWRSKRLQPLHTQTSIPTDVFEVQVVHRFISYPSSSKPGQDSSDDPSSTEDIVIPSSQNLSSSATHEQPSLKVFGTPLFVTIASDKTAQDMHQALLLQTARFWRSFNNDLGRVKNKQDKGVKISKLPYEVRVVNLESLTSERGESLPINSSALLQHFSTRSVLALDWTDYHDYTNHEVRVPDDASEGVVEAAEKDPSLRADLESHTLSKQATENTQGSEPVADDDSPPRYAVPLMKCMDALMCEESISLDDHWVCERCGVPREGTRLSAIWRLPDLVMIQLKRFQYLENQHKRKVRALVDFPLKGLDFSKWMSNQDEAESSVYDLYAVANHVGGLTRGHYTAYCCYDADFPESSALFTVGEEHVDVQCPELWFRFDDEKVSEIAAGDVVTDAAYVLFYKRRTLSSHNVLRYAL
ncbi:unnamed protein product [Peronospora belbahrii]|uniref:Ubiquitinyl hydrolase 1 n=1 Tax=Peronospora belbahrii TaxID=622444 RepID=A0AAU9LDH5_9STRA|nr:unnamed protein product [Peronospora belbahrii]